MMSQHALLNYPETRKFKREFLSNKWLYVIEETPFKDLFFAVALRPNAGRGLLILEVF
jgi:hypothetical protein